MPFQTHLRLEQAHLLTIAEQAEQLLKHPKSDEIVIDLSEIRAAMFEALGNYQAFVHRHVFEAAKVSGDPARMQHAERLKAACISLSLAYQEFTTRWAHRSAVQNWAEYRLSARRMVEAVRQHVRNCPWPDDPAPSNQTC